jgi:hypothetical protein
MCSWYTVGRKSRVENLEQQIDIKLSVKIGKSASEKSALYGEYAMKKSSSFE